MQCLNPVKKARYIERGFREYISSTYNLDSDVYSKQFSAELKSIQLLKGPYIGKNLEFQTTKTINELIDEGLMSREFRSLGDMYLDRKLRSHQERAIRQIHKGHNLIITTGTGSGKTESFLYPVLNEILHEENVEESGIRAIFLFPMNALVNDQFDRVRKILSTYPKIRYGVFTGNTKNKEHDINGTKEYIKETTGLDILENELLDREQIRKNPPHILFTNYSMLEYILLRPEDDVLLTAENTKKWKFIVLDEAHTYKGALGIEIGMLLRRLQSKIGHSVQFILTSATLGENDEEGIKKIQEFGYKLTSKNYEKEDIIFSDRIRLSRNNSMFRVDPTDYLKLYNEFSMENLNDLLFKYNVASTETKQECRLYDLMIKDENLYNLNDILRGSMPFVELIERFNVYGFDADSLSAFIDLICKCTKNNLKIMDLKYHSFIRSVSGAFVTLGESPKLSLTPREYIDSKRAFEIGACSKCNSMYIIGVEKNGKLYQNNSVDIYENYDEDDNIVLDYYILESELQNHDVDFTTLHKYTLCPKCGKLIDDRSVDKDINSCEHTEVEKIVIYKVDKGDSKVKNNLTICPICNGKSKKGLVRTVSMGKESATALITQIFFEALERNEAEESEIKKPLNKLLIAKKEDKPQPKPYVKQILSFSDSRQQASFAVKFAENNHHRLLRKRLIVEILKNNSKLSFEDALAALDAMILKSDLFDTKDTVSSTKQARITLLNEILNVDGVYGGEGLGLFYFDYSLVNELTNGLSNSDIKEFLKDIGINKALTNEQFNSYLQVLINTFRIVPAVLYEGLTQEDKENYFAYRMFDNHVRLIKTGAIKDNNEKDITNSVHGLISKGKKSNKLETYTQLVFGVNKENADKIIEEIWNVLVDENNRILEEYDKKNKLYHIRADKFVLHNYTDSKWYYCKKCRKITRFDVEHICPSCFSINTLEECNPNEFFESNYYRRQYVNKKIEKLVYKEHTAQLSAELGKERQIEFKNKKINYLSCSTTFEMGIDIGSLENVLLRNVPPSPSNYIQRAGRAGRAQDSSAFVLTYCSPSSHDYTFFENPLKMVAGVCQTPVFAMENHKIIFRHLLAVALSNFFKINVSAFHSVKSFYLDGGYEDFIEYLRSKDAELIQETNEILSTTEANELKNGHWIDLILSDKELNIEISKERIVSLLEEFEDKKQEAIEQNDEKAILYFAGQITKVTNNRNLIGELADGNLIPKYGFPTDLVEIRVKGDEIKTDNYDLTRDMTVALSEYAPDSEIMVDKKTIVSRYINKWSQLTKVFYYECSNCHKTTLRYSEDNDFCCPKCRSRDGKNSGMFVTPQYGFTGEIKRNTATELKPKRSYASPVKYIGNGSLDGELVEVNEHLKFYTAKNDELLIVNENSFFSCPKCGYSLIDNEHGSLPKIDKGEHYGAFAKCNNTLLERHNLGFSYKTDVLKMVIDLPFSGGYNQAISVLYALLEGISLAFDIERNDIDGIFINENNKNVFVLFDTVPGGAGHVKRLLNKKEMISAFKYAYEKVSQECCDTACYNCIKNYKNQKYHEYLRRPLAKDFLNMLMETLK